MNKLEKYQNYANKIAEKLGLDTKPIIRWSGGDCLVAKRHNAHCHVQDGEFPKGTICIKQGIEKVDYWHQLITHEVTHLAVKSGHSSVTFARRMVELGQATHRQKVMARAGRRHHHIFSIRYYNNGVYHHSCCCICQKEKE